MRILFVSTSSGSRGGGEIFLLYAAGALRAAGHTVGLWASRHPRMDELARQFGAIGDVLRSEYLNTYDHWHRGLLTQTSASRQHARAAEWMAWKPDVVHLNKQNLEDGLDLLAAARALPVPHLCTIHITQSAAFLGARFSAWRDAGARRALRAYRGTLIAVAPPRAAELAAFVGNGATVRTVNNGVPLPDTGSLDRESLRRREGLSPTEVAVVALARLEPQKRPLRFLEHARRIRAAVPRARMHWIGSGSLVAEWDQAVIAGQLGDRIRRIDWREDARHLLPAFDIFLHTAAFEGLPLAILEAMAAGLPCLVERPVHAQLPGSLQSCSHAVDDDTDWAELLGGREALSAMGRRARTIVETDFSTTAMGRGYEALYREACQHR